MNENTAKDLKNNFFIQLLTSRTYRLYRHLAIIVCLSAMVYFSNTIYLPTAAIIVKLYALFFLFLLFYTNMYWLAPKYLFRSKYLQYVMAIAVCTITVFLAILLARYLFKPYEIKSFSNLNVPVGPPVIFFVFLILILIAAATSVKLFQRWITDAQKINELEKTTMQSELNQLKNQINPHFLFNTLNNANVLTQKDPEKASQVLMKLSDLLRYQLYDSTRNKVLLTSDIHFIEDFLSLEKIRRDNFESMVLKEGNLNGVQLSPLLLITFVENAVKHNTDAEKMSYVHMYFAINNGELNFKCINSKPQIAVVKTDSGGLGLANVKRRLELLYPLKHKLCIEDKKDTYTVNLTLRL